jgi:hypothetical protein
MYFELCKLFLFVALFVLHCAALGFPLLRMFGAWPPGDPAADNRHLRWFFAISIGLVANVSALFVLGLAGCWNPAIVLGVGFALLVLAVALQLRNPAPAPKAPDGTLLVEVLFLALIFAVTLLSSMHPPGLWDDTSYHLPLARSYVRHGGIFVNEYLRYPLFPQNMHLLMALGLMLGGDTTAQAFATLPIFVIAIGLLGAAQWICGSIAPGVLGTALLLLLQPVSVTLGYAFVDDGLALFCWGTTLALALRSRSNDERGARAWLIVAAVLAGAAAGTKPFGGVFALLGGAYVLLGRDRKSAAIYGLGVLLFGSWWYVRSLAISGDPVHPAGGNLFGHFLWNAADMAGQMKDQSKYGVPVRSLNLAGAFAKAGVIAWLPAFAGVMFRAPRAPLNCLLFLFLAYVPFWFVFAQIDRYLAPVFGVATFLTAFVVYRVYLATLVKRVVDRQTAVTRTALSLLVVAATFLPLVHAKLRKAESAIADPQARLTRVPGHDLFVAANALIPRAGDRIVQVGFENAIYFFDGTAIGDWFGPGRYRDITRCEDGRCGVMPPAAMKRVLAKFDAKMLAVSTARFPRFDEQAYREHFDVVMKNDDGVLMVVK